MLRSYFFILLVCLLGGAVASAREPSNRDSETGTPVSGASSVHNTQYIDGSSILMFVTNHGSFGRDLAGVFGHDYGTFFPYAGISSILDGSFTMSPLYSAGLWIGGRVGNETRVAIAEYSDEFVPGPMLGGTYMWDDPSFRVYRLYADSLEGNPNADYLNWPFDQGAPVDSLGLPLMRGQQMLWSVYNDANPQQHFNNAGETDPLGIEVQQSIWSEEGGFSVPVAFFAPVAVTQTGSAPTKVTVEVVDGNALNGHSYEVTLHNESPIGRFWRLTDVSLGTVILDGQTTLSENNSIVTDGFIVQVKDPTAAFASIAMIANGAGVLDPPQSAALASAGFPTPNQADPGPDQQIGGGRWAIHINDNGGSDGGGAYGAYDAFLERVTRLGNNDETIGQYDYEMRFSGSPENPGIGGSYAVKWFQDGNVVWVPFELWRIGIGTQADPSDDLRLIPYILDYGNDNSFNLESYGSTINATCATYCEHSASPLSDDPYTDLVYWNLPADTTPGETGYFAAESQMLAGMYDGSLVSHEILARTVLINVDAGELPPFGQALPEPESVIRLTTFKQLPEDTFAFAPTASSVFDSTLASEGLAYYIEYKLIHKGYESIDSCFVAIWSDPDLGGAGDDMVGCVPEEDLMYCYNSDADDEHYRGRPPAIGFKLNSGPIVPDPGKMAVVDGQVLPNRSEVGIYSFNKYINGTDPDNFEETYCYMRGLTKECEPYLYNGTPTRFVHAGDPVTGFGDLDDAPSDKRMMGSYGPFTFNPGDTQTIVVKMAVAPGPDRLSSVTLLREILNYNPAAPLAASTIADPDPIPPLPRFPVYFYLGNLEGGVPVQAIDQNTIRLNGTLPPDSVEVVTGVSDFSGEVLRLKYRMLDIQNLYAGSDFNQLLTYAFDFEAGEPRPFVATGSLSFVEISVGDFSGDGRVSLTDLTQLVAYMFQGGQPPHYLASADTYCDGRGQITLTDLSNLVNYLFLGGAEPELCEYWLTH